MIYLPVRDKISEIIYKGSKIHVLHLYVILVLSAIPATMQSPMVSMYMMAYLLLSQYISSITLNPCNFGKLWEFIQQVNIFYFNMAIQYLLYHVIWLSCFLSFFNFPIVLLLNCLLNSYSKWTETKTHSPIEYKYRSPI